MMRKISIALFSVFSVLIASAQGDTGEQNIFKSNLKIYVVVAVIVIILSLIFTYLFSMEKRIKQMEDNLKK